MRHTLTLSALAAFAVVVAVVAALVGSGLCSAASPPDRTAVVDRLGDDRAVLLVEPDGGTPERRVVDPTAIPEPGRYEGAVLDVTTGGYAYDRMATRNRERTLSRWFDALAGRM